MRHSFAQILHLSLPSLGTVGGNPRLVLYSLWARRATSSALSPSLLRQLGQVPMVLLTVLELAPHSSQNPSGGTGVYVAACLIRRRAFYYNPWTQHSLVAWMTGGSIAGKVIAISGTPGTGKSAVGALVSRSLGFELIELGSLVFEKKLYIGYDDERQSYIIDEPRLREHLRRLAAERGNLLVIGHYSEIVDDDVLDKIVVLRVNPIELAERLRRRGWPPEKVLENVEAELLGVCTGNALLEHPSEKVCEVDASGKDAEVVSREVIEVITGARPCRVYVDWLNDESVVNYVLSISGASSPGEQRS